MKLAKQEKKSYYLISRGTSGKKNIRQVSVVESAGHFHERQDKRARSAFTAE